jgi:molybdate transport system regulatory protein
MRGKTTALGPGKAELLARIDEVGSIGEAAKLMDMSYMRAWNLVKMMNECFKEPLVVLQRGGKEGGGAVLTKSGKEVLRLYWELEVRAEKATLGTWGRLKRLLKP